MTEFAKTHRFLVMLRLPIWIDLQRVPMVLNSIQKQIFENSWILTCSHPNVLQNFSFFFSHKLSSVFLSYEDNNDECDWWESSQWTSYVTPWKWSCWWFLSQWLTRWNINYTRISHQNRVFGDNYKNQYCPLLHIKISDIGNNKMVHDNIDPQQINDKKHPKEKKKIYNSKLSKM